MRGPYYILYYVVGHLLGQEEQQLFGLECESTSSTINVAQHSRRGVRLLEVAAAGQRARWAPPRARWPLRNAPGEVFY